MTSPTPTEPAEDLRGLVENLHAQGTFIQSRWPMAAYAIRRAADTIERLSSRLEAVEGERKPGRGGLGWLYISDDGIEWSADHPVRSGEVPDARLVRRATNAELLAALKDAWEAHGEAVQGEASSRSALWAADARAKAAEARAQALQGQLDKAVDWLRTLEPHLDAVICYASDMNEHPPNGAVKEVRAFLASMKSDRDDASTRATNAQPGERVSAAQALTDSLASIPQEEEKT